MNLLPAPEDVLSPGVVRTSEDSVTRKSEDFVTRRAEHQ